MAKSRGQILKAVSPFFKSLFISKDVIVILFIMAILAIIIVPLPSFLLDFFLTISIAISVLIILIGLYINKPTDFSAFPTLLLMITLFRLALNVATTRMILSNGHLGVENVSEIISAFGSFVVGGNYVIGVIIFSILVIVNYLVITNGSTRVAEVQARFTLEAMPGKQMAIDADLNSGLIEKEEAQKRREILVQEADFYGSMDGASKFVKGDAIAGIIITFVNIIGGFLIGIFGHNMSISQSASVFTILTIGDGLVSQIPALIVSTATGIVITRATKSEEKDFASGIVNQLLGNSKILLIVGGILLFFALIPGLPALSLGFVGILFILMSYLLGTQGRDNLFTHIKKWLFKKMDIKEISPQIKQMPKEMNKEPRSAKSIKELDEQIKLREQENLDDKLKVNILQLYLGYGLTKLAEYPDSPLMEHIRGVRENIAQTYGFIVPPIRIKVNPKYDFPPNGYEILLKGIVMGNGEIMPDKYFAINSTGMDIVNIEGIKAKEPALNMDGLWIDKKDKDDATIAGYTIAEPSQIISVHISEIIKRYAEEIVTRQDVKYLIERLKTDFPNLIIDAEKIPLSVIHTVLKELLRDEIPIKDMLTILETIVDVAAGAQNSIPIIMDYVRSSLSRVITDSLKDVDGIVKLFVLLPESENYLMARLKDIQPGEKRLVLSIGETQIFQEAMQAIIQKSRSMHIGPILFVDTALRRALSKEMENNRLPIKVIAYTEVRSDVKCEILDSVKLKFSN